MAYVIRNGKLEKARQIKKLTSEQKIILKVSTQKQLDKLEEVKKRIKQDSESYFHFSSIS